MEKETEKDGSESIMKVSAFEAARLEGDMLIEKALSQGFEGYDMQGVIEDAVIGYDVKLA